MAALLSGEVDFVLDPALQDLARVRKALYQSIDIDGIQKVVTRGLA